MEELRRESCIRGHHIYKNIWNPAVGEVLVCEREPHNAADRYFVAITKGAFLIDDVLHLLVRQGDGPRKKATRKWTLGVRKTIRWFEET